MRTVSRGRCRFRVRVARMEGVGKGVRGASEEDGHLARRGPSARSAWLGETERHDDSPRGANTPTLVGGVRVGDAGGSASGPHGGAGGKRSARAKRRAAADERRAVGRLDTAKEPAAAGSAATTSKRR